MKTRSKTPAATRLWHDLQTGEALQHQTITSTGLTPHLALLRTWQAGRLARTCADLLADPRYRRPVCLFFLSDLYAARDFSQRNHDVERIQAFLAESGSAIICAGIAAKRGHRRAC